MMAAPALYQQLLTCCKSAHGNAMQQCLQKTASGSTSPAATVLPALARELDLLPARAIAAARFGPKSLALLRPAMCYAPWADKMMVQVCTCAVPAYWCQNPSYIVQKAAHSSKLHVKHSDMMQLFWDTPAHWHDVALTASRVHYIMCDSSKLHGSMP